MLYEKNQMFVDISNESKENITKNNKQFIEDLTKQGYDNEVTHLVNKLLEKEHTLSMEKKCITHYIQLIERNTHQFLDCLMHKTRVDENTLTDSCKTLSHLYIHLFQCYKKDFLNHQKTTFYADFRKGLQKRNIRMKTLDQKHPSLSSKVSFDTKILELNKIEVEESLYLSMIHVLKTLMHTMLTHLQMTYKIVNTEHLKYLNIASVKCK